MMARPQRQPLLQYRLEYWQKRLEHTQNYTQSASKQIYLIDGAVLAFIYFIITTLGLSRPVALFILTVVFVLACLNFLHSRFIKVQQHWYLQIDQHLLSLLNQPYMPSIPKKRFTGKLFISSHRILSQIHIIISLWLLGACLFLFLYALGVIPEIHTSTKDIKDGSTLNINNSR
jgi:hypothetical protein